MRRRFRKTLRRLPIDRYRIGLANSVEAYESAFRLTRAAYVFEGAAPLDHPALHITEHHVLPEALVLLADDEEGNAVGTMTVTLDSPAGLPLDANFRAELDGLRQANMRLAEYGSLAVLRPHQRNGLAFVLSIAAIWLTKNLLRATHCVIGVRPSAVALHRHLYNFSPIAPPKRHAQLQAETQLMAHEVDALPVYFGRYFPRPLPNGACLADVHDLLLIPHANLPAASSELASCKLPRAAFRELYLQRSDRLKTLSAQTMRHLASLRSDQTIGRGVKAG